VACRLCRWWLAMLVLLPRRPPASQRMEPRKGRTPPVAALRSASRCFLKAAARGLTARALPRAPFRALCLAQRVRSGASGISHMR
jgi:hypothetical protein